MSRLFLLATAVFLAAASILNASDAFVLPTTTTTTSVGVGSRINNHDVGTTTVTTALFASTDTNTESTVSIDDLQNDLDATKLEFDTKLAACESMKDAEALRREYLGKKGPINSAMSQMRLLSNKDKPKLGAIVNILKAEMEQSMETTLDCLQLSELEAEMEHQKLDVTFPGLSRSPDIGRRHPLSMTMQKAVDCFVKLGYDTVTSSENSPEIETDYYCFEALNCPKDHPARDMQDTFYLTEDREYMLRTHTSAVQIRQLEQRSPPLRIVAPGRVYRRDDIDATHSLMFHQIEILALEKKGQLDLGHLKGTVEHFLKEMLGPDIKTRFRGSYFPFTEPSMEVDVFFRGKWMEVLGCGMVDPRVLEKAGIDPNEYSGFAAGFGVERFAMIIHQIKDLREFVKSDKRFLQQFPYFYDDGMTTFLQGQNGSIKPHEEAPDYRTEQLPITVVKSMDDLKNYQYPAEKEDSDAGDKKQQKKKSPPPSPSADIDISKLDIRVGVIQKVWEHEEADKLYCEEIDLGEEGGPRQIASGLKAHYSLDEMEGRRVLVLANLKARKLMGFPSHGMVLCAASEDGETVEFIDPPEGAAIGERVFVKGLDGEPATENQVIKKKMLDKIFPDLKTDANGVATYKGVPLETSGGVCLAKSLKNVQIA